MTPPTDGAPSGAGPTQPSGPDPSSATAPPGLTVPADPSADAAPTSPRAPVAHPVQYKGEDLDPERGPGLGCFRFQLVLLVVLLILTPIGVNAGWPDWLTTVLLFVTLGLLLVAGQTIIFLLRLVAADRRSQRRPLRSRTPTVGELASASAATGDATTGDTTTGDAMISDGAAGTLADRPPAGTTDGPTDAPETAEGAGAPAADGDRGAPDNGRGDANPSVRQ